MPASGQLMEAVGGLYLANTAGGSSNDYMMISKAGGMLSRRSVDIHTSFNHVCGWCW